jgi:ribosome hibernation promoting factor
MIPIEVRSKAECAEQEVYQFAERRIGFALDRIRDARRIVISIEDVNGPKGGADKRCQIVAEFGFASVIIEEIQQTWQSAVARAMRRLSRRVARELKRVNRSHVHLSKQSEITKARNSRWRPITQS